MYITLTHQRKNGIPACRQGQFRKIYRVGTHVSNQSAFVQTLRNHHGLCHGIPKLTGSFLLECGSGKRRCRRLFNRPCSNIFYFKGSILTFLKETLGVIFDQIGTPTYARDLAQAIFVALEKGIVPGIYHFSNEGVCSWYDFTKAIHRLAGITTCHVSPLHTEDYPTKACRPHYSVLDKTKLKKTYGVEVPYWMDSLAECIEKLKQ
jgi:hypothetical protein